MRFTLIIAACITLSNVFAQDCSTLASDISSGLLDGSYTISTTCNVSHNDNVLLSGSITVVEGGNLTIDITGGDRVLNMVNLGSPPSIVVEGDGMDSDDGILTINDDLGIEGSLTVQEGASLFIAGNIVAGTVESTSLDINGTLDVGEDLEAHDNVTITGDGVINIGYEYIQVDGVGTVDDSGFTGDATCTGGCGTLPVELLYFRGFHENGNVVLEWSTSLELNNSGFYLERSLNGIDFSDVSFIQGNGTSSEINNYSFIDTERLNSSFAFYRLNQVDFDGTSTLSSIISIEIENQELLLFPTIFEKEIFLVGDAKLLYDLTLYDPSGRIFLRNNSVEMELANKNLNEAVQNLPKGVYFVRVNFVSKSEVFRILKI